MYTVSVNQRTARNQKLTSGEIDLVAIPLDFIACCNRKGGLFNRKHARLVCDTAEVRNAEPSDIGKNNAIASNRKNLSTRINSLT